MKNWQPMFDVDFPDPDVIRVGDTYYMLCTTMYFFPGCEILESKDLISWKHVSYVFDSLDGTDAQKLRGGNIYGKGMWAATIRYHEGMFYICFVANDTHSTYLFRSEKITGPWRMNKIEGFFHDSSILFDDDGRVYIAYGNREIFITELNGELTAPKEGGFHRMVVRDSDATQLGYEGTHFYKINGVYYLIFIHSQEGRWYRAESCFYSRSLDGEFVGGEVFADDNGYRNAGIAQGAIVDTPEGDWYAILFQDRGGSGRIPYLIPMHFEGEKIIIGDNGKLPVVNKLKALKRQPSGLVGSDDFKTIFEGDSCFGFSSKWQFNHEPDMSLVTRNIEKGSYSVTSDCLCTNPTEARNSLTQRMSEIITSASISVDASKMNVGDLAGMAALQYLYGFIAIRKDEDGYSIVYMEKPDKETLDRITVIEKTYSQKVRFSISTRLGEVSEDNTENDSERIINPGDSVVEEYAMFSYHCGEGVTAHDNGEGAKTLDVKRNMPFCLEHFTGYRYSLTFFSTKTVGGSAEFSDFVYR